MGVDRIYFAMDGFRNDVEEIEQDVLISKVQDVCDLFGISFQISRLKNNYGIFVNMFTGLDWFFEENAFGMILEDDTIPDPSFADFVLSSKVCLEQSTDSVIISGWRGLHVNQVSGSLMYKCSFPLIWGWATSREKWLLMREWFLSRSNSKPSFWKRLSPSYGFWRTGYSRAVSGKLDSWANVLAYNYLLGNYRSIVPPVSLIENVGLDLYATNSIVNRNKIPFPLKKNGKSTNDLDEWLAKEVYRISFRHILAPFYGPILDYFFSRHARKSPLEVLGGIAIENKSGLNLREGL
jgi:hypothetical protein